MGLHRRHVNDPALLGLIEEILRGHKSERRDTGIDQGSSYSPIALNVELHHTLDLPFSETAAHPALLRYADDVAFLCKTEPEGQRALQDAQQMLQRAGLALKDEAIVDLRTGQKVRLLGFDIRLEDGQIRYGPAKSAWKGLEERLPEVHRAEDPPKAAQEVVEGWVAAYGPALEGVATRRLVNRILRIAAKAGFREISRARLERAIRSARDRWRAYRKRALRAAACVGV